MERLILGIESKRTNEPRRETTRRRSEGAIDEIEWRRVESNHGPRIVRRVKGEEEPE
jgi:hypothetical protein